MPASLYTLNAAVFGPEVPWFNATKEILFIPISRGSVKLWYCCFKTMLLIIGILFMIPYMKRKKEKH